MAGGALWLVLFGGWLGGMDGADDGGPSSPREALPPLHVLQGHLKELLTQEARCRETGRRAELIAALCRLHQQLVRDPRYPTSPTLQSCRAQLWSRLRKIKTELQEQFARARRQGRGGAEASLPLTAWEVVSLLESAQAAEVVAADTLACTLALSAQTAGGAGMLGYGGSAVPPDYGPALVALIERTINPAFWDVNGGPGTIRYYAPLQCLVVRATTEVHGQVGGLLGGLRAAGR